jgi:two-component system, NarL family, sensor histidine kinase BarA
MFRRIRQLRISLAAKCQILFGAAVVMIIGAALFVPWHRMDDLMNQINERAAYTLSEQARIDHILQESHAPGGTPANEPPVSTTQPWTELLDYQPPRLAPAYMSAPGLTKFEVRAIRHFLDVPESTTFIQFPVIVAGESRYRYARRLLAQHSCMECHGEGRSTTAPALGAPALANASPGAAEIGAALSPTTLPAAYPRVAAEGDFLGIVSVDILSQVDESQIRLNRLFIFLAGLLAGSLAIAVFYLITTRIILHPVRVLQETAEKVSQGDLNIRSDINTGDEFQQLAETFNTMLANLKLNADQLQTLNRNLDLKLGQLAESNVALYESNRLKSEFLANVSHELRTPLNSILGFAELLRETLAAAGGAAADSKPSRYLQNILTSGRNLLELINDLLDLAKIEAGKMDVRSEPLSLGDLFEALGSVLKPLCEAKGLTIAASAAADVPIIQTDPAKLQQILYNLLSNAIKFSPRGGKVELAATREDEGSVRITVVDQGPGIEAEKQAMIFEKFRQVDAGVTREHGGTGLGLSIAKELTLLLGGTIGVRSVVGQGAAFWVVLPLNIQAESKDVRARLELT